MQNGQEKINHEIVARRYFLIPNDAMPNFPELGSVMTALPLYNVIDWEEVEEDWHESAPDGLTAVVFPYETKIVDVPFRKFHSMITHYKNNERRERKWSRFN